MHTKINQLESIFVSEIMSMKSSLPKVTKVCLYGSRAVSTPKGKKIKEM